MSRQDDSVAPREGTFRDALAMAGCEYAKLIRHVGVGGVRPVDEQMIIAKLRARLADAEYDNPVQPGRYA